MAAFSYQYHGHPFLVDSSSFFPSTPTKLASSFEEQAHVNTGHPLPAHHQFQLHQQETSSVVTNHQDTSCADQGSKAAISYTDPSPFVTQNHSPESSMVVDKLENGEQVTQNVTPMGKKRKTTNGSSLNNSPLSKDSTEGRNKKQKKSNGGVKGEDRPKEEKKDQKKGPEEPPTGYIHVRARRGQATDSHSLAERVRREKISERMKMLQRLVPGCDKVTGKALVLDEIINYVQSLQNQVEFLSMRLASLSPFFFDLTMGLDTLLVRPDQNLNSIPSTSTLPSVPQCSTNQATAFVDTTTMTNITTSIPGANSDYLLDYSSAVFLQGQRSNVFSEYTGGQFWEVEDQRQKLLHPYGHGNNLCSLN